MKRPEILEPKETLLCLIAIVGIIIIGATGYKLMYSQISYEEERAHQAYCAQPRVVCDGIGYPTAAYLAFRYIFVSIFAPDDLIINNFYGLPCPDFNSCVQYSRK